VSLNPLQVNWQGKVVWVIGASSGIGRATASALHGKGARVIVSSRNEQALKEFATQHPGAMALALDVSDVMAIRGAAAKVIREWGLNCLVYSAAHYNEMSAQTFNLDDLNRHLQVNYGGLLGILETVVPFFLQRAQQSPPPALHISVIGSVAGYFGLPKSLAYGPTKAALINLAETLYVDLHGQGIGVSLISPGFVATPLTAQNNFKMPALISPEQAAAEILQGWSKGEFEIHFPKKFTWWLKLLKVLPYRLAFAATRKLTL
jgi:NAD(P)-dependent dehydrogenase (short-subunit alcohol dehydrogenase family)